MFKICQYIAFIRYAYGVCADVMVKPCAVLCGVDGALAQLCAHCIN